MEKISFTKMSGAGNDFIVLKNFPVTSLNPALIKKLCDRRNGIGADGVINISSAENSDFKMNYFNADGSTGTLCGNGARCALRYVYDEGIAKKNLLNFISGEDYYSGEILKSGQVRFNLHKPGKIKRNFIINLNNKDIKVSFADTGSPHAVIFADAVTGYLGKKISIDDFPVDSIGRDIRYNQAFAPGGANVNFVSLSGEKLYIRTYERGVENETLACGTGSVAAAVISFLEKFVKSPVQLVTRSGEELIVDFSFVNDEFLNVSLTGPAKITFTGEYKN